MNEAQLRRLFCTILGSSLLTAVGTSGCGVDNPTGQGGASGSGGKGGTSGTGGAPVAEPFWSDLPLAEFTPPACDGTRWLAVHGLNPASPVDYVALREKVSFGGDAGPTFGELDATGAACGGATDPSACNAALLATGDQLATTQSCGGPPYACQHFLATTAGDTVRRYLPGAEYKAFLGAIDTPAEALLLAADQTFMGSWVTCNAPDRSSVRAVPGGYQVVLTRMVKDCAPIVQQRVLFEVKADGTVTTLRSNIASVSSACVGRRNEGLVSSVTASGAALADFFAEISHLEAASVSAFTHLRDELAALGANDELLAEALRARDDEVRHAAVTGALARRFGREPEAPVVSPLPLRSLEQLACENAREGCVRETFGALVASHQAATAADPDVARAFSQIAEDETRHAALAWKIASWADALLSDVERERVQQVRRAAIAELRSELAVTIPESLRDVAGVPEARVALDWMARLERELWS